MIRESDSASAANATDATDAAEVPERPDLDIDAAGLACPLPILRAKKGLSQLASGQVLRVISTDPMSRRDFQAFARQTGNALLRIDELDAARWAFWMRRR